MANLLMVPRVTPDAAAADGSYKAVQGYRDGTISTTDFLQRMVMAGNAYAANAGSASTPLTCLTTWTVNRPEFVLRNPAGSTAIIPVSLTIAREVSTGTINEWTIVQTQNDIGNGTSSAATLGPINLRSDRGNTAVGVPRQHYTADATTATNPIELWRTGQELATAAGAFDAPDPLTWNPSIKPLLMPNSSLEIYTESTTTAQQVFLTLIWIETPASYWT